MDPREVLTRPARPPDATVRYGPLADQIADVRLPAVDAGRPLVVFIHGGFWMAEYDRAHAGPLACGLADAGYPVATLEYRRVGVGGGWPATFDDVSAGVAAMPDLIPRAGRGIVLMGHSAGGQLALWAGRTASSVRGIVALAPVADLARGYALDLGGGAVRMVIGGGPEEFPERFRAVDPAVNLPIGVPTVVVHGHLDRQVPYEIGRDFAAASRASGDETTLMGLAGIEHFGVIDPQSPAWDAVLRGLASVRDGGRG